MADGAFRDATAWLERLERLEAENTSLREELAARDSADVSEKTRGDRQRASLARAREEREELLRTAAKQRGFIAELEAEIDELSKRTRGENEQAFVGRLRDENEELVRKVAEQKAQIADLESGRIPIHSRTAHPDNPEKHVLRIRFAGREHDVPALALVVVLAIIFFVGAGVGAAEGPVIHARPRSRTALSP